MKLLKIDSRGTDVYILQLALQRAGYLNEEPDGIFGRRTENAVLHFQQANGLKQDGIAGGRTWNALMPYLKGYIVHKTVKGDTLWKLSQQYNTNLNGILEFLLSDTRNEYSPDNLSCNVFILFLNGYSCDLLIKYSKNEGYYKKCNKKI